jgi:hypothetical protein
VVFRQAAGRRGGAFFDGANGLGVDLRNNLSPAFEFDNIGFRVASVVPEPGSLGLLILGLAGMVTRRRRISR